jgi:hypothetical protein
MESTDPVMALLYLMAATRPIAVPVSDEDAASIQQAFGEFARMQNVLGRRTYKRCYREARHKFVRLDDTRELP